MNQLGPRGYLTISETARQLGVARGTVYRMIGLGQLRKHTIGRREYVHQGDVELFSTARFAAEVGTNVALRVVGQIERDPELRARFRALLDGGGAS